MSYLPILRFPRIIGLVIILLFFVVHLQAQERGTDAKGKIMGRIIDSATNVPIDYATISLVVQESDKVINGTTTNEKGEFKLEGIPNGTYKMLVYFIGYKTAEKRDVVISNENQSVFVKDLKLVNKITSLKEVTVTAEKELVEMKIDKMVYNAEKDLTSQGGVATDMLKKVPQVSVDVDGNVELQGNANIRFLINGKPSSIFGNNLSSVLQSIPASQIQSIEIITSPGAKYDAEGTGGIINIIMKKTTVQGFNGNISLSGGTRLENGNINLTARKGNFGVSAFLSGNAQLNSTTLNSMDRTTQYPSNQSSQLLQNGTSEFNRTGYQTGLSFDWTIKEKNSITGSLSYNYFGNNSVGLTNRESKFLDSARNVVSDVTNAINATNNSNSQTYDWNLNYKRTFEKKDQELNILYTSSFGNNYSYYIQTQKYLTPDSVFSGSYANNPGVNRQSNFSIDYVHPFTEKFILETGAKAVLYQISSQSDVFLLNTNSRNYDYNTAKSLSLSYGRNVYAYYLSATYKLFDFLDVKTGCRYEYTETKANFSNTGNVNVNPYGIFVPSGVISHKFKNNHTIKLSYTYRIQRPDYRDINPFFNLSDPKNITTGNPNLKPELTHNIELGYNKSFEKGANINVAAFYRGNRDDIQSYSRFYTSYVIGDSTYSNVTIATRENIGKEDNIGVNLFVSYPITKKINIRSNISGFQRYIVNYIAPNSNISGFNYRANLNFTYQIASTLVVELFGNFNSPRLNVQGKMPSFTTYNFAFRKQFWHKKASLALTATNPFNKYVNQKTELTGPDFTLYNTRQLPYRSFGINFTYRFGKMEFKKQRDKDTEDVNLTRPEGNNN